MANNEPIAWITVNGKHIPIFDEDTTSDISTIIKQINPNYKEGANAFDKEGYNHNCVSCALAFEAAMKGEDVEANPFKFGDPDTNDKTNEHRIAEAFDRKHDIWEVGADKRDLAIKRINDMMEDFGPKSRALLFLYHKGGKHVVNVVNENGKTTIVDAQSGKYGNVSNMLKYYNTKTAEIMRVDDATLSDEYKRWAYKKRS